MALVWAAVVCLSPEGFAELNVQAGSLMWLAVCYLSTGSLAGLVTGHIYLLVSLR